MSDQDALLSLTSARAYVDAVRDRLGSLDAAQLIDALARLTRVYREYPELALERPRRELTEAVRSIAEQLPDDAAVPLLTGIATFDPTGVSAMTPLFQKIAALDDGASLLVVLGSLDPALRLSDDAVRHVANLLRGGGRGDAEILAFLLDRAEVGGGTTAVDLSDRLIGLLGATSTGIDRAALAAAVRSARRRSSRVARPAADPDRRDALLALARRLAAGAPQRRFREHRDPAWPSGTLSFDEFLLQWPCEVKLPVDLPDREFVDAAYRAILLRPPEPAEMDQYVKLLQQGTISRQWVAEDLLGALPRPVRVVIGDDIVTEPDRPEAGEMPVVASPWSPAP